MSPDQARKEAARIIARIKSGQAPIPDPPKTDPTMAELAERYQREHVAMHCKPATMRHYRIMLAKHIVPALGELTVAEVERKHILAFQYELREKPTVANRALEMLVKMFNLEHRLRFFLSLSSNFCSDDRHLPISLARNRQFAGIRSVMG